MSDAPETFDQFVQDWCNENIISLRDCADPRDQRYMYRCWGARLQAAAAAAGFDAQFARAVLINGAAAFIEQQYRQMEL